MGGNKSGKDLRRTYYDHEPAYKALKKKGSKGWRAGSCATPFSLYWNIFKASGFLPKGKVRVLDFGCGGGEFSILLARKGYDVTGIDFSRTAVKLAKEKIAGVGLGNVTFRCRDALSPRLAPVSFDAVFSISVLHCLIGKDRGLYWSNMRRSLKDGGVVALTTMVDFPGSGELMKRLKISRKTRTDAYRTRYFASESEILGEAASAGLDVLYRARRRDLDCEDGCDDLFVIARK